MRRALAILVALSSVAHADDGEKTKWTVLGTRITFGSFELGDTTMRTSGLALTLDRTVYGKWRVIGEYEYLWSGADDPTDPKGGIAFLPERGHRVHAGVRRRIEEKTWGEASVWLDVDVGGGAMLFEQMNDNEKSVYAHGFLGFHGGTSLIDDDEEETDRWDAELIARVIATRDGPGFLIGFGFGWGD